MNPVCCKIAQSGCLDVSEIYRILVKDLASSLIPYFTYHTMYA